MSTPDHSQYRGQCYYPSLYPEVTKEEWRTQRRTEAKAKPNMKVEKEQEHPLTEEERGTETVKPSSTPPPKKLAFIKATTVKKKITINNLYTNTGTV